MNSRDYERSAREGVEIETNTNAAEWAGKSHHKPMGVCHLFWVDMGGLVKADQASKMHGPYAESQMGAPGHAADRDTRTELTVRTELGSCSKVRWLHFTSLVWSKCVGVWC